MKMEKSNLYDVFQGYQDLPQEEQTVFLKAKEMISSAYAPYSGFFVGSAVLTESGNIYVGCNQENAAYPLCMCGERIALYNAGANEPQTPIKLLAIVCSNQEKSVISPATPCGACRQVIAEFEARHHAPFPILLGGDGDAIWKISSGHLLLPLSFGPDFL